MLPQLYPSNFRTEIDVLLASQYWFQDTITSGSICFLSPPYLRFKSVDRPSSPTSCSYICHITSLLSNYSFKAKAHGLQGFYIWQNLLSLYVIFYVQLAKLFNILVFYFLDNQVIPSTASLSQLTQSYIKTITQKYSTSKLFQLVTISTYSFIHCTASFLIISIP